MSKIDQRRDREGSMLVVSHPLVGGRPMRVLWGATAIDSQKLGEESLQLHRRMLELLDLRAKVATLEKDRDKKARATPGHKQHLNRNLVGQGRGKSRLN